MSDHTAIQWSDATWNPTTGCDRVSPGCAHCYALDYAPRLQKMAIAKGADPDAPYMRDGDPRTSGPGFGLMLHPGRLDIPLRWSKPRRIFVNSMSDLFHPEVPDVFVHLVWAVMGLAKQHVFQVLTKRPERMRPFLEDLGWAPGLRMAPAGAMGKGPTLLPWLAGSRAEIAAANPGRDNPMATWIPPNVWVGTSIENDRWTVRADDLRSTPAAVRFLSCEPLLGPLPSLNLAGINWVIVGGESGPEHRPFDPDWARDLRDRCAAAGVAFFFKQHGGRTPKSGGRELDGRTWDEFPRQAVSA